MARGNKVVEADRMVPSHPGYISRVSGTDVEQFAAL